VTSIACATRIGISNHGLTVVGSIRSACVPFGLNLFVGSFVHQWRLVNCCGSFALQAMSRELVLVRSFVIVFLEELASSAFVAS
jgi:hypothetical protein